MSNQSWHVYKNLGLTTEHVTSGSLRECMNEMNKLGILVPPLFTWFSCDSYATGMAILTKTSPKKMWGQR